MTSTKGALARGHAVSIVGYNNDGFVIRNSLGKQWGDRGYAYASDSYVTAMFQEAYGLVMPPKS